MSCTLNKYCVITDLITLKQVLFPEDQSDIELNRDDDYDNRWNWDTSELMVSSSARNDGSLSNLWLTQCLISMSPLADVMAFARNDYIAIYRIKRDANAVIDAVNDGKEMHLTYEAKLTNDSNDSITCILCVPLVSQQKSSIGCADWTAIIVGFSSGFIRIYTESGGLLLSQLLHDEPVIDMKCQTFGVNNAGGDQLDEILLVYGSVVVLIEGFSLYQTLRSCRNQMAKAHSVSSSFNFGFGSSFADNSLMPLTYKKWSLQNCDRVVDCDNAGINARNQYDHLVSQSIIGSSQTKSPTANLLIAVGDNPYVGFFRAHDGASHTILNELTQAVFNKVKNMIPLSLFGSNKVNEDNSRTKIEPSTPIPLRLGLFDQRDALKVNLSPNKRLAAVLDDFGRITLIDVHKWMAIRMWKGYRDAEIGWIEADEDNSQSIYAKKALFIVIYAPKRGILEIWCCQHGPRVTAFNVGKCCKLFQFSYSMMGLNHMLLNQLKSLHSFCRPHCFLFDYTSATIYNIEVPFLCALTDRNSKKIRDIHLLKELKNILKLNGEGLCQKVLNNILMMKTADVRKEALEAITQVPDLALIRQTSSELRDLLLSSLTKNELDYENQLVEQMCCRIISLCNFYEKIQSTHQTYTSFKTESEKPPDIQYLIEKLNLNGSDIAKILSLIAFRDSVIKSQPLFPEFLSINICQFISYFSVYSNHIVKNTNDESLTSVSIELKMFNEGVHRNQLQTVSYFMYISLFQSDEIDIEDLFERSLILPSNLLLLLFTSWLSSNCCDYWKCWENFNRILKFIVKKMEHEKFSDENDFLSSNWSEILQLIYESNNITGALIAVNMIKAVNCNASDNDNEWETLHIDKENLNLMIKQFEDLFLLDMLLRSNRFNDSELFEDNKISVTQIIQSGPGIVSELVAKWAINCNITPDILNKLIDGSIISENNELDNDDITTGEEPQEYENIDFKTTVELFDHVRRCFPNCLESDVLLANCSWELLVRWNKDPSVVENILSDSLLYLNYVSSAVLKHNVACLLWKTYVQKRFENLANLMEKMGRTPKERICKKELGMGENSLEGFLDYSCHLLDFILQTNMMAEMEPLPLFSIDDWWKSSSNASNTNSARIPLVILAVHQKIANSALVLEHSRLSIIMFFIATFQLKSSRPLSLFSTAVKQYFFKEFHSFPVYTSHTEKNLSDNRIKFLLNVITAIVQTLPNANENEHDEDFIIQKTKFYTQANKWYGMVIALSREWELNIDEIRRKFVCELYNYGCDSLAEEIMPSVVDLVTLGLQLLTVAGHRFVLAINSKCGSLEEMHTLPPNTLFWLKSLDLDGNCYAGSSHDSTLALLEHTNNYVYCDKTNGRICESLIDAVKSLSID